MLDDFKTDILLDKHRLDEDAVLQASLFLKWGEQWAYAVRDRDRAVRRLQEVEEKCDKEIREFPHRYGWTQTQKEPTEKFVESKIPGHPEYIKAKEEVIEADFQVNLLNIVKTAFTQRDSMITALAGLYKGAYFSSQSPERFENAMTERAREAQNENLKNSDRLMKRNIKRSE